MRDEEDDKAGMEDALERAREKGGADTFGAVAASAHDAPDDGDLDVISGGSGFGPDPLAGKPEFGPVEPPPPTPDDVAPAPPGIPDKGFESYAPTPATKPAANPLAEAIQRYASRSYKPSAGLSDEAIEKARGERAEQVRKNDFSRAISDWLMRRPFTPTPPEDKAGQLLEQRDKERSQFEQGQAKELNASAMLARALKGERPAATPGGLSEYQKYEMDRNARLDAEKKADAERKSTEAKAQLERDRTLLQHDFPNYDLSQADEATIQKLLSLRHAKAAEAQAAATAAETKEQHISSDTAELAGKLGDPAAFQAKYDRLMSLKKANGGEIPGLGVVEGVRQQPGVVGSVARTVSPPSEQAIEGRKLVRQLAAEYARSISGAGVSNKERDQLNAATVDVENDDSRIAEAGLNTLKDMYESKVAMAKAGARPEAVQRIESAKPPPQRPIPAEAAQRPPGVPANAVHKGGKWYVPYPDGSGWDEIEVSGG